MTADHIAGAAMVLVGALWLLKHWWRLMHAWADRSVDAMVARAPSDPLPDVDSATDAEFEALTRGEIR